MAFVWGLVGTVIAAALAGWSLLGPVISIDAGSDWRAVSLGLRRSGSYPSLAGGARAVVHVHDLEGISGALTLTLADRDPPERVEMHVLHRGRELFSGPLRQEALEVVVPFEWNDREVDVFIQARSERETGAPLYLVPRLTLRRDGARFRLGPLLPALAGGVVFCVAWRRGRRREALPWAVIGACSSIGLFVLLLDPHAALRFRPGVREWLRLAALACLWMLALLPSRPRGEAVIAVLGTTGLLYGFTIHQGFISDDYLWARPWPLAHLLSTLTGSEDPLGLTQPATYRPLPSLTRALDFRLWGLDARGWHATNLTLHALNGGVAWLLLERLGLSPRGALAGALAWIAHPLSASAAAWASQRTDGLMAFFYLGALLALLHPRLEARHAALAAGLLVLSLLSKEVAVTLPIAAYLAGRCAFPSSASPPKRVLMLLCLMVAAFVAFWLALFPDRLAAPGRRGVDFANIGDLLRLASGLLAPIYLPTGYEKWWTTRLREWPPAYLGASAVVSLAPWLLIRWSGCAAPLARLTPLAMLWPFVIVAPMLGVRLDLYRLGLLPSLCFGLTLGALVTHAERYAARWTPLLVAGVALWLAPIAVETARAWGPSGFMHARHLETARQTPEWQAALHPETRALFLRQLELRDHARAWLTAAEQRQ